MPCLGVLCGASGSHSAHAAVPLGVVKGLDRLKLSTLLAKPAQLAIYFNAEGPHVLLTDQEPLVVRLLISQQALTALNLR